eukprot:1714688-Rhodomonas_salina.3
MPEDRRKSLALKAVGPQPRGLCATGRSAASGEYKESNKTGSSTNHYRPLTTPCPVLPPQTTT